MLESLKIACGGAVGTIIYQVIRFGTDGIDWLGPIVVGVLTFVVYALLSKIDIADTEKADQK